MYRTICLLSSFLALVICIPAFSQITIDGNEITFPDSSTQSTAATGGGGDGSRFHVVHVSSELSTTANGNALISAVGNINDADWGYRYVVQLDPGEYDLGTQKLTMRSFVHLVGMGQDATRITSSGSITVQGIGETEIRSLSIENHKSDSGTVYFQHGGEATLFDIGILHYGQGAGINYGVKFTGGGGAELKQFNIEYGYWGDTPLTGTFYGIHVSGDNGDDEGSYVECSDGYIEAEDEDGAASMTLIGVQSGTGNTDPNDLDDPVAVDFTSNVFMEINGKQGFCTAVVVASDAVAFLNSSFIESNDANDTYLGNTALTNDGTVYAIGTSFIGTLPAASLSTNTTYLNCIRSISETPFTLAPILNSESAVDPNDLD